MCAAGEWLVWGIDDAKFSVALNLGRIRIAFVCLDRQDRVSFARLSILFDDVLVDVNLIFHRLQL